MSAETYLNHPTFGLLYRVCLLDDAREIFTTLYAQRLFFLVVTAAESTRFESMTRAEAKLMIENRLRALRRSGDLKQYQESLKLYQTHF